MSQITLDESGQPASGLTLYDYQITAVNELRRKYRAGAKRLVLCAPPGSGKTEMSMAIIKSSQTKGSHSLFICDQRELVRQTSRRFSSYGIRHGVLMHGMTRGLWSRTVICSAQTLIRRGFDYINKVTGREEPPDLVVIDECFHASTEILTESGFVPFADLGSEKVAQWHSDGSIDFTSPARKIKQNFDGELVHIQHRHADLLVTPNHDVVTTTPVGRVHKDRAKDVKLNGYRRIPVSGKSSMPPVELRTFHRLAIAFQADGNLHYRWADGRATLAFSFSRQRKIDRFLALMKRGSFSWKEGKCNRAKRRFFVYGVDAAMLHLPSLMPPGSMSASSALAVLKEMLHWDGSEVSEGLGYFSTADESVADYYQALAAIAGCRCRKTRQVHESEQHRDIWRLFIGWNVDSVSTQTARRSRVPYCGPVYCVEVPSGAIVVRRNGKVCVAGNCHTMWTSILRQIREKDITLLGLSATPFKCGKHYQDVVNASNTNELVRRSYLSPIKVVAPNIQVNTVGVQRKSDGEYVREDLGRRVQAITGDILGEWEARCDQFYGQPVQTIVFCPSVADCQDLAQRFQRRGHDFRSITYKQKWKEKQPIIDAYREGKYLGLISCSSLAKGFDVPQTRVMIDAYTLRKAVDLEIQRLGRVMRAASGKKYGLLIDHCIAADQRVLTRDRGLQCIRDILGTDLLWDGVEWVHHCGAVRVGRRKVIEYAGLIGTEDHKVYTSEGWATLREAADRRLGIAETGFGGQALRLSQGRFRYGSSSGPSRRKEAVRHLRVRDLWLSLRRLVSESKTRPQPGLPMVQSGTAEGLPLVAVRASCRGEAALHKPQRGWIRQLWRSWHRVSLEVGGRCRAMGRRSSRSARASVARSRPGRERRSLRAWEPALGYSDSQHEQQARNQVVSAYECVQDQVPGGPLSRCHAQSVDGRGLDGRRDRRTVVPAVVETEREVWDIRGAGPRNRFTVEGLLTHNSGNYLRFMDEIFRFFAEGCPKLSTRPRRVSTVSYKRKAAEMRCRCGFVLEKDMESCPACGATRVRPRGKLVSRPGELTEVRGVDGEDDYLPWPPSLDIWPELCAIACRISPTNIEKANKIARAKYWDLMGRKCHREFEVIWRDPDVRVDKYCRQQYLRWKRQQADA
ncbi:MAG: DEAD/DEAH box helicase family protein [Acidobacteria bacterium]|nr:DEAD/DEAH box helicase family protein [Acidobacteriota bacterium]